MITVRFACGHGQPVSELAKDPPICKVCGERRVQGVQAPKPRFQFLEAMPVSVKES